MDKYIIPKFTINVISQNKVSKKIVIVNGGAHSHKKSNHKGGGYDGGDEFDDILADESLLENIKEKIKSKAKFDDSKTGKEVYSNILILTTDSLLDLKKKLFYLTDIPIEHQFLFGNDVRQHTIYIDELKVDMTYKYIKLEDIINDNIGKLLLYNNKSSLEIIKEDETMFLGQCKEPVLNLVNYKDNTIYDVLSGQVQDIYYYEYILKYWPYLNRQLALVPSLKKTIDYELQAKEFIRPKKHTIVNDILYSCTISNQFHHNKSEDATLINLKEIFDYLHIGETINYIHVSYYDNVLDTYVDIHKVALTEKNIIETKMFNRICINLSINGKLIKYYITPRGSQIYEIIINDIYDKLTVFNIISPINKIIKQINEGLGYSLGLIKMSNIEISGINLSIDTGNKDVLTMLIDNEYIRFAKYLANNVLEYNLTYFNHYNVNKLRNTGINMFNDTTKLEASKSRARIKFTKNVVNNKMNFVGFNEQEYDFIKVLLELISNRGEDNVVINTSKSLKNKDVLLYDLKKYNVDKLYVSICQKPNQPVMYFSNEIDSLPSATKKRLIKWWNFTSKKEVYYDCPSESKPHLTFIVGKHPMGYCLPCCGKTKYTENSEYKKDAIYDKCMTDHVYTENKSANDDSKYIFAYGKSFEVDRLINMVNSKFNKVFSTLHTPSTKTENYYGIGVGANAADYTFVKSILLILNMTNQQFVKVVKDKMSQMSPNGYSNSLLFYRFLDGDIVNTIRDLDDLYSKLEKMIDINVLYEDILFYIFDIRVIKIVDYGGNVDIKLKYYKTVLATKYVVFIKNIEHVYFPIVSMVPSDYFKDKNTKHSIFSTTDLLITKLLSVLDVNLYTDDKLLNNKFIETVEKNEKYKVNRGFFNNNQYIILLELVQRASKPSDLELVGKDIYFYVPIEPIRPSKFIYKLDHIMVLQRPHKINKTMLIEFMNMIGANYAIKDRYLKYEEFKIPLYNVFDDSFDNPFYINYIVCRQSLVPLDTKEYNKSLNKSFDFIEDVKLLYKNDKIMKCIDLIDSNMLSEAKKLIHATIINKKYDSVILSLLQDRVFRTYIQYNFKDKLLTFNIQSHEKILIN